MMVQQEKKGGIVGKNCDYWDASAAFKQERLEQERRADCSGLSGSLL